MKSRSSSRRKILSSFNSFSKMYWSVIFLVKENPLFNFSIEMLEINNLLCFLRNPISVESDSLKFFIKYKILYMPISLTTWNMKKNLWFGKNLVKMILKCKKILKHFKLKILVRKRQVISSNLKLLQNIIWSTSNFWLKTITKISITTFCSQCKMPQIWSTSYNNKDNKFAIKKI